MCQSGYFRPRQVTPGSAAGRVDCRAVDYYTIFGIVIADKNSTKHITRLLYKPAAVKSIVFFCRLAVMIPGHMRNGAKVPLHTGMPDSY
jgi:hypothetical protein